MLRSDRTPCVPISRWQSKAKVTSLCASICDTMKLPVRPERRGTMATGGDRRQQTGQAKVIYPRDRRRFADPEVSRRTATTHALVNYCINHPHPQVLLIESRHPSWPRNLQASRPTGKVL